LTHKQLVNRLIAAHKRGVEVKVITCASAAATPWSRHQALRDAGIPVKIENWGGKMHKKSMTIDGKIAIIGSMNFSGRGESNNDENVLIIENADLVGQLNEEFFRLWSLIPDKYLKIAPLAESPESGNSCFDGMDNDHNGLIDIEEPICRELLYDEEKARKYFESIKGLQGRLQQAPYARCA
jgi:phosphatidylserine/phosphatidylglycerophosphate/cardiolipin synthase-like enzyme